MKKLSMIALLLAVLTIFSSCGGAGGKGDAETTEKKDDEAQAVVIDFAKVVVSDFVYAYVNGDTVSVKDGDGAYVSSKPSVATVDKNGNVTPVSPGVTLIGYEKDKKAEAIAVCVFAEGQKPDRSSGAAAELCEVGGTYYYTAPVSDAQFSSSNSAVVDVSAAPQFSFVGTGYACITCASVSRPFTYSFIIYDRTVENN